MNKKTKILTITNFILWILAMIAVFLGAIFVFVAGKGYSAKGIITTKGVDADADNLIYIGEKGATAVGGILIAISVMILAMAILFLALKLNKSAKKIVTTSFITTLIVSIVMIIMAILDVAKIWSIWPWLINFGCLMNFGFVLLAFKTITANKPSKSEAIKQIEYLNANGFLKQEEYKELKERVVRILKTETREIKLLDENGKEVTLDETNEVKMPEVIEENKEVAETKVIEENKEVAETKVIEEKIEKNAEVKETKEVEEKTEENKSKETKK